MIKIKKNIVLILLLAITSCAHIKLDKINNDEVDTVQHKERKYLIPIPKGYCRYDAKNKGDKAAINFVNDSLDKKNSEELVALYEESCETKKLVTDGELRDSPRSIEVDVKNNEDTERLTRSQLIDIYYKNFSERVDKKATKEEILQVYEELSEKKLLNYGFSKNKAQMIREDIKGMADQLNFKLKKDQDEYAAYMFKFINNKNLSSYSVKSSTKLYNKITTVTITRTLKSGDYDRSIENQIMKEAKEYMKDFVMLNDKNDFKEYSYKSNKIKIFVPQDFCLLTGLKERALKAKYKNGSGFPGFNFEEVFLKNGDNNIKGFSFSILLPHTIHDDKSYGNRNQFIEKGYQNALESRREIDVSDLSREKNGLFILIEDKFILFTTVINEVPVIIVAEAFGDDKKIDKKVIKNLKKDLVSYVDLLDKNQ